MSRARNAAIAYMTLLRQRSGGASTPVNDTAPSIDTAPIVDAVMDYTAGTWTNADSVSAQAIRATTADGTYSAVGDAWDSVSGTPYTYQSSDFGYCFKVRETAEPGGASAESAATGAVKYVDAFASDSGLWLDGGLSPAAVTIASDKAVWTPSVTGSELQSNGDMETGSPPTGYTGSNATLTADVDAFAGAQALKIALTANNGGMRGETAAVTSGGWLKATAQTKAISSAFHRINIGEPAAPNTTVVGPLRSANLYGALVVTAPATQATMRCGATGFTSGDSFLVDNVSFRHLEPATCLRLRPIGFPARVSAKVWNSRGTQAGVVLFNAATDYIAAYEIGSGRIELLIVANGVATRSGANATYVAGAVIELIPNAAWTTVSVNYNGSAVIAATSIAAFSALTGDWYAGLIRTHDSADISTDAFDDFAAERVDGADPF